MYWFERDRIKFAARSLCGRNRDTNWFI